MLLYATIEGMGRVMVHGFVGKFICFNFAALDIVYAGPMNVFALSSFAWFGVLQSKVHEVWVLFFESSLENRTRYLPNDHFKTFPFPNRIEDLEATGALYHTHRQSIMSVRKEGLTKTYNRFHNPDGRSGDILDLHRLHRLLDLSLIHI